jgi:hypothetical protein
VKNKLFPLTYPIYQQGEDQERVVQSQERSCIKHPAIRIISSAVSRNFGHGLKIYKMKHINENEAMSQQAPSVLEGGEDDSRTRLQGSPLILLRTYVTGL